MNQNLQNQLPQGPEAATASATALHRSGAVARMLGMPVATLRVWERRYRLTQTALSPGGQRLYTADDVQRLALVKQLTDRGHAIGSLAALSRAQLQQVAFAHQQTHAAVNRPAPGSAGINSSTGDRLGADGAAAALSPGAGRVAGHAVAPAQPGLPFRLAVVGASLGARLQRPALLQRLEPGAQVLAFDTAAQAATALQGQPPDAVLLHEPELHEGWLTWMHSVAPAWRGLPLAALYRFAAEPVCEALAAAGISLLREPQPDAVLVQWLQGLRAAVQRRAPQRPPSGVADGPEGQAAEAAPIAPRRWGDEALAGFAAMSSTIACECPRHLAELLVQLSHFESYSANCAHRNAEHAELHAYLQKVAATARAGFEAALERVALHEGLVLPPS